jgi:hypothetical protein
MFFISNCGRRIPLGGKRGSGKTILVDAGDYERTIKAGPFYLSDRGYAVRSPYKTRTVRLHRLLAGIGSYDGTNQTDHINGDKLDNRRKNLRVCTNAQNQMNIGPRGERSYKGIGRRSKNRWYAAITVNGRRIRLGRFLSPEEAAKAYNTAAQTHFGEFARINHLGS